MFHELRARVTSPLVIEYTIAAIVTLASIASLIASVYVMGALPLLGYCLTIIGTWLFISLFVWGFTNMLESIVSYWCNRTM